MKRRIFNICLVLALMLSLVFSAIPVRAAGNMSPSEDCVAVLKKMEGFSKYPVADYSQYTIGYGTQCPVDDYGRYRSQGITEKEAEQLLKNYLEGMCGKLNEFAGSNNLKLTQNQFDALVLLTYNIGTGWFSGTSDLKTAILTGATGNDLIYYMSRWCTANYEVLTGLVKRRLAEADLFLNGNYAVSAPSYYSYVSFNPNEGVCTSRVQGYDASDPAAIKAVPTRKDYRFLGWYTAEKNGQWITDLDTATAEKTLYARWQKEDGKVTDGKIQGTACNYKRKVNSSEKLSVYELPNEAKPFAQLDSGITVKIVADYVDSAGAKWGKMEGGGWVNLGTTHQIVTPAAKTVRENITVTVKSNNVNVREGAGTTYAVAGKVNAGDSLVISETKMVGSTKWGRYSGGWLSLEYTDYLDASDSAQNSATAVTAAGKVVNCNELRIRSGAGTQYPAVGSLKRGERVEISEVKTVTAAAWGKTSSGWICLSYVQLDSEIPENEPPAKEETSEKTEESKESPKQTGTVVNCNSLNVRKGAGLGKKVVDSLPKGTWVEIYETKTVKGVLWGRIKQGWISMDYIRLADAAEDSEKGENTEKTGQTGIVTSTTSLNIRASASISAAWAGSIPSGSKVVVYETKKSGGLTWGKIDRGWVCMSYVRLEEKSDTSSDSSVDTSAETIHGKVFGTGTLRIRSGAGTHTEQVGTLTQNTAVEIFETAMVNGEKWGHIKQGWICMTYIKADGEPEGTLATVQVNGLRIRSGPGTDKPAVGSYNQGTQIEILEKTTVNGGQWGRTKQGWVSLSYVSF